MRQKKVLFVIDTTEKCCYNYIKSIPKIPYYFVETENK